MLGAGAAALAVAGALSAVPPAVGSASAQALGWTNQAPAVHPESRVAQAMAYDGATGSAVLFGGYDITLRGRVHDFSDTWAWG